MTNRGGVTPRAGAAAAGAVATALDADPEPTHAAAATITDINTSLNTPKAHRSVTAPTSAIGRSVGISWPRPSSWCRPDGQS